MTESRRPAMQLAEAGRCDVDNTKQAWHQYVNHGRSAAGLVRPHVAPAWDRSREGGCDPLLMKANLLDTGETQRLLAEENQLIRAARPFMATLSEAAGNYRHAAMLGDSDGRILAVLGDEQSVSGPQAVPGAGALLDEPSAGANGIGTTLAHGAYVELIGPEHFIEGFHPFTCQGIPLRSAFGRQLGVLSMSVRRLEVANRLRDLLFCATEGLECQLIHEWLVAQVAALAPDRARWADKLRQDLVQHFTAARLEFELAARAIARGQTVDDLMARIEVELRTFKRLADTWRSLVETRGRAEEELRLDDLIADVFGLFATEARFARVELDLAGAGGVHVLEDRCALTRDIVSRLLDAMQAAGEGGRVRAELTADPASGRAALRLHATAPGIASRREFGLTAKIVH